MWYNLLLSTDRTDGILLRYQQLPYTSCAENISYCYWFQGMPSGEMGGPFCGGERLGEGTSEQSSPSSAPDSSTSSSSFGDAIDLFYFVDKSGDLYILRSDNGNAQSSLVFKSFSSINNPPMGLAISYFPIEESSSSTDILTTSSSSLSSESSTSGTSSSSSPNTSSSSSTSASTSSMSSSFSSQSTVDYDYNVYILRKNTSTTANMAIHDITGYLKGSIDFSSNINFLGLSLWPNNNNLLVAISENLIHMLYISSGQIGMYSFDSPVSLAYGIACKNVVDENSAEFFVRSKDQRQIVLIKINKKTKTCSISDQYTSHLSKWNRLGGLACDLGIYGLIGEMNTIYHVVEETKGYSHVSKTVILTGTPTLSFMFAMPFTVYGCCTALPGSTSTSLIESVKSPILTFRRYDIDGNFIENFNSLFLGNFQVGTKSDINIINMLVEGVSSINNVKLGVIENGIIGYDIDHVVMYGVSDIIDPSFTIEKYFSGVNTDGTSGNSNNIEVGLKSGGKSIESKYVYLAMDVPQRYVGRGYITLKWFFDYE